MQLAQIEYLFIDEGQYLLKTYCDVIEGNGLKCSAKSESLVESAKCSLDCFALVAELEELPPSVEVFDHGDPAGVRRGDQVAPANERIERVRDDRFIDPRATIDTKLVHEVVRSQVHLKALLSADEQCQDATVERRARCGRVAEHAERRFGVYQLGLIGH